MNTQNSWLDPRTEIRISPIGGKGLFATASIKEGEPVVIWGGYVDKVTAERARQEGKLVMQWDDDLFSVEERGGDDTYFINHSCDPNLWMKDAYTLIVRRVISPGEEITADYALWEADENYVSKWTCSCGSPLCRHKITGKDWMSKGLQERYRGHFSPLINKRVRKWDQ